MPMKVEKGCTCQTNFILQISTKVHIETNKIVSNELLQYILTQILHLEINNFKGIDLGTKRKGTNRLGPLLKPCTALG